MHSPISYIEELQNKFHNSNDIMEYRSIFNEVYQLIYSNKMDFAQQYILLDMMNTILSTLELNSNLGKDFIINDLISIIGEDGNGIERYILSEMRESLSKWIGDYDKINIIKNEIINTISYKITKYNNINSLWTLSSLGSRNDTIIDTLWGIVLIQDNDFGDACLSVIARLRPSDDENEKIINIIKERSINRRNYYLYNTLRRLEDIRGIDILISWIESSDDEEDSSLLQIISHIIERKYNDINLHENTWRKIENLLSIKPVLKNKMYTTKYLGQKYNIESIIYSYLNLLNDNSGSDDKEIHSRYLIYSQISEMIMPNHIIGWRNAYNNSVFSILINDLSNNTKSKSNWFTREKSIKESALITLLKLEFSNLDLLFEKGIANESNKYMQHKIISILSCFCFESIPHSIEYWIKDIYEGDTRDDSGEFIVRMSAIQLARSAASIDAFNMLLNFGFTFNNGQVLQASADALSETSLWLVNNGDNDIINILVNTIINGNTIKQRQLVAETIAVLAERGKIPDKFLNNFLNLLEDDKRDDFEKSLIIYIAGFLSSKNLNKKYINLIANWAVHNESWIKVRALETLVRWGEIESFPNILSEVLGITQNNNEWINNIDKEIDKFEWRTRIIGLMASKNPNKFESIILDYVENGSVKIFTQIINLVSEMKNKSNEKFIEKIKKSLVNRIYNFQTKEYAEFGLFNNFSLLFNETLSQYDWDSVWNDWMPLTRSELADALGKINYQSISNKNKSISLLLKLISDGQYGIRRAAYRALAMISKESLQKFCLSYADSSIEELRCRASEAWGWLDSDPLIDLADKLFQQLSHDSERSVRESTKKAWKERRDRILAQEYLDHIQNQLPALGSNIMPLWSYGEALAAIADDTTEKRIEEILYDETTFPNVRYWLQRIKKFGHERWQKEIKEWGEPWDTWNGIIEEGVGEILLDNKTWNHVQYSLWYKPASSPMQKNEWGGVIWLGHFIERRDLHEGKIDRGNGRKASFIIRDVQSSNTTGSRITFLGQDEYPFVV